MAKNNNPLLAIIDRKLDVANFREQHWEGTFWEYLDIVVENPLGVCRGVLTMKLDGDLLAARPLRIFGMPRLAE